MKINGNSHYNSWFPWTFCTLGINYTYILAGNNSTDMFVENEYAIYHSNPILFYIWKQKKKYTLGYVKRYHYLWTYQIAFYYDIIIRLHKWCQGALHSAILRIL